MATIVIRGRIDEDLVKQVMDKYGTDKPTDLIKLAFQEVVAQEKATIPKQEKTDEDDPKNWGKDNPYRVTKIGGFNLE